MNRSLLRPSALLVLAFLWSQSSAALEADDLGGLVGFTIIASSSVKGEYAGVGPAAPVELDNGMIFELSTGFSTYTYRPRAIVFGKANADAAAQRSGDAAGQSMVYKLLVGNNLYEARRLR